MRKILVVDDDVDQRELYAELFSSSGYEVTEAEDGLDAWDKAKKNTPDLVFTGIDMPKMGGFELINKLRDNLATAIIPIFIFSHLGRDEDKQKAEKIVNVYFKVKGYDSPAEILNEVKTLSGQSTYNTLKLKPEDDDRQAASML